MALINTEKGMDLFDSVKQDMVTQERSVQDAIQANDALIKGSKFPKHRNAMYRLFAKKGFLAQYKKYYTDTTWKRIRSKISVVKHKLIERLNNK